MTMKDSPLTADIEKVTALWEGYRRRDGGSLEGWDWNSLLPEEQFIFGIDPDRFLRMLVTWCCYQALVGSVAPEDMDFDPAIIEEERQNWPNQTENLPDFMDFACQVAGLTMREAHAIYYKYEFWTVRMGLIVWADEPKPQTETTMHETAPFRFRAGDIVKIARELEQITKEEFAAEEAAALAAESERRGDPRDAAFWWIAEQYLIARELAMSEEELETNERDWQSREWVEWPLPEELDGTRFLPRAKYCPPQKPLVSNDSASYRILPHNQDAEQGLLGALLVDNRAYEKVGDFLRPAHFFLPAHQRIYDAIIKTIDRGQTASPVTLRSYFEKDEDLKGAGGAGYLAELAATVVSVINAADYGRTIYDLHLRREVIALGEEMVNEAFNPSLEIEARDTIEMAESRLYDLAESGEMQGSFVTLRDYELAAIKHAEKAFNTEGHVTCRRLRT